MLDFNIYNILNNDPFLKLYLNNIAVFVRFM